MKTSLLLRRLDFNLYATSALGTINLSTEPGKQFGLAHKARLMGETSHTEWISGSLGNDIYVTKSIL